MQKTVEAMRLALTVTGIILLFVFGSRAASQARNMKLAGATPRHAVLNPSLSVADMTRLNPLFAGVATAESFLAPLATSSQSSHQASAANPTPVSQTAATAATASQQATPAQSAAPTTTPANDHSLTHGKPTSPKNEAAPSVTKPPVAATPKQSAPADPTTNAQ